MPRTSGEFGFTYEVKGKAHLRQNGVCAQCGVSIAWATVEHLHDRIGARTLFATHYHQLTDLAGRKSGVHNLNVAVREWQDEIVFLHKIVEGGTDRSYGLHVARLAGVPDELVDRAREILRDLERDDGASIPMPLIGLSDLVRNKRAAGRHKDLDDVEHLEPLSARRPQK